MTVGIVKWPMSVIRIQGKNIPRIVQLADHILVCFGKGNREKVEDASTLDTFSLEMFENIAYVMAKHADANIPDTPEEWLDGFNTFSIYQVLPQLIELWGLNVQTDVSAKKTSSNRSPDDNTFIFASLCPAGD